MTKLRDITTIKNTLRDEIARLRGEIAEWAEKLKANPYDTLEWGDDITSVVAKLRVHEEILQLLETAEKNGATPENIFTGLRNYATKKTIELAAKYPSWSNELHNIMDNRLREAWANTITGFSAIFPE